MLDNAHPVSLINAIFENRPKEGYWQVTAHAYHEVYGKYLSGTAQRSGPFMPPRSSHVSEGPLLRVERIGSWG